MGKREMTKAIVGAMLLGAPATVFAQSWVPGSEITGQSAQVETNGVINTVYFDPGGVARIQTPGGNTVPRDLGSGQRPALPDDRRGAGVLALCAAIPGRAAAFADQQLQFRIPVDCAEYEHGAARPSRCRPARPLGQVIGASSANFGMSTSNVPPSSSTIL